MLFIAWLLRKFVAWYDQVTVLGKFDINMDISQADTGEKLVNMCCHSN